MGKFDFIAGDVSNPYALPERREPHEEPPRPAGAARPAAPTVRVRDWVLTMALALFVAFFIRSFLLEAFRIPTSSMEKSLLVGDFVLVSKLHYGPRTPVTFGIPFTDYYVRRLVLPPKRLPGFQEPRRGDVVVFNYPVEERPVDRKTHYIKRIIGLPGDTLSILDKVPFVNGLEMPLQEGMQQKWLAFSRPNAPFPVDRLRRSGVSQVAALGSALHGISFESTVAMAREVASWNEVAAVEPFVVPRDPTFGLRVFPEGSGFGRDNYGPLYIPSRGDTIALTPSTWPAYAEVITRFEGHTVRPLADGTFEIDGRKTREYVFEQDYFFVMGDNRDSSYDSRIWGFVPSDHVVGKAIVIYFSWDEADRTPRYDRIFTSVR